MSVGNFFQINSSIFYLKLLNQFLCDLDAGKSFNLVEGCPSMREECVIVDFVGKFF